MSGLSGFSRRWLSWVRMAPVWLALGCGGGRSLPGALQDDERGGAVSSGGVGNIDNTGGTSSPGVGGNPAPVGGAPSMGGSGVQPPMGAGGTVVATTTGGGGLNCPAPVELESVEPVLAVGDSATSANRYRGSCGGDGPELVFEWVPPATGRYQIDTLGSLVDTVLYLGETFRCDRVDEITCNDDSFAGLSSWLVADLSAGVPVFIFVDTFVTGGPFKLNVQPVEETTCPHGDLGNQLGTPVAQGDVPQESQIADGDNACNGGPPRVTYRWQAPYDGPFVFDTRGSDYDTVLSVRRECFGEVLDCNDDTEGVSSQVVLEMSEGQQVIVEIARFGGVACSGCPVPHYQLNIEQITF